MGLEEKQCIPCRGGVPPLAAPAAEALLKQLKEGWKLTYEGLRLEKTFPFKNFPEALNFCTRLGMVAEDQGHHPDLHVSIRKVIVEIWTHKIDGLTESDFIFAAKTDQLIKGS